MNSPIQEYLNDLHSRLGKVTDGTVADSSPALARAKPEWFGICLMTMDGHVYEVGETRQRFTMQSVAKPFTFALALEDNGREKVLGKIKVEPSGDSYNAITLDPKDGRPSNPMINAGALAATGLVKGRTAREKFKRILAAYSRYAGREFSIKHRVHRAIGPGGDRSRAIFYLLRDFGILTGDDPGPTVDAYFEQCAIEVDCRDLAQMAATLANHGVNPVTKERALDERHVTDVLAVMASSGMYDHAGEWMFRVGMPAKSGVGGGIIAVLPGQLGLAAYSPPLDEKGNSVRGLKVCEEISGAFGLHVLRAPSTAPAVIRRDFCLEGNLSSMPRSAAETTALRKGARDVQILELQGDIHFTTAERVIRRLTALAREGKTVIVDVAHCLRINAAGYALLRECCRFFREEGRTVVFAGAAHLKDWEAHFESQLGEFGHTVTLRPHLHSAIEWVEGRILRASSKARKPAVRRKKTKARPRK